MIGERKAAGNGVGAIATIIGGVIFFSLLSRYSANAAIVAAIGTIVFAACSMVIAIFRK
jgi:hypothetical protein